MFRNPLRTVLIILAAVFIAAGIENGGMRDTFNKGVMVCLECVGIG